jgi:sucrose phosphorylase
MVYNFSLPPLTLHALHTGDAEVLSGWAQGLTLPSARTSFFNFLASHDGIGLTPARGLLPETAVAAIAERVQRLGGHVSYRNNPDGSQSPYELNINYLDALGDPDGRDEPTSLVAQRFLTSQAIMLALRGVPGVYFHSLFGSRGWPEGVRETGRARTINREKVALRQLEAELASAGSLRHQVFAGYSRLLRLRAASPAFHPAGDQVIHRLGSALFAVQRTAPDGRDSILCLHNVSARQQRVHVSLNGLGAGRSPRVEEMIQGEVITPGDDGVLALLLSPYQVRWLRLLRRAD